ncbi:MAG: asparagine synthase-related protein [Balneolaceae bacterium]
MVQQPIDHFVNLLDSKKNQIFNMSTREAESILKEGNVDDVRSIDGSFALVARNGKDVYLARSIHRPMRYFLAKQVSGPLLVVAERIDEIAHYLEGIGLGEQFRPDYTRMVPAHYVVRLQLIGCPDPNPEYHRYFTPERNRLDGDLDKIGNAYIGQLAHECRKWLRGIPENEPVGVLFSGGIDSGSLFLVLYHQMLELGLNPARLKAFTLSSGGGADAEQAHRFLDKLDLNLFLEVVDVPESSLDFREAIRVIEDYKRLDVEAATVTLALARAIRERYPDWIWMADGDGGDENLKDYPIEENPELTIRSVLNNPLLYHEGWGVDKIKHSLTYSGGQSRGHVRSWAPLATLGFRGFSPFALPNVIEISEGIPFIQLTDWNHDQLYALKGEIVQRGVKSITNFDMPVYPKRRFQEGVVPEERATTVFPPDEAIYRSYFRSLYARS